MTAVRVAVDRNPDRFNQVVTGKGFAQQSHTAERDLRQREVVAGSNERNWDLLMRGAQLRMHLETGEAGHMHVENHACRTLAAEMRKKSMLGIVGLSPGWCIGVAPVMMGRYSLRTGGCCDR